VALKVLPDRFGDDPERVTRRDRFDLSGSFLETHRANRFSNILFLSDNVPARSLNALYGLGSPKHQGFRADVLQRGSASQRFR
jgi:hypothetical protein